MNGQKLIDYMGLTADDLMTFPKPAKLGARIGPADNPWSVRFSGRTQREAIGTELPWIGNWKAEG